MIALFYSFENILEHQKDLKPFWAILDNQWAKGKLEMLPIMECDENKICEDEPAVYDAILVQ